MRQVAEHVLAEQLRNRRAAVDEAAGDRDAVAVVVLQRSERAEIGSISPAGRPGCDCRRGADRAVGAIEQEVAFLDRPAVVAAERDAVDFLDVVLADVGEDQIAVQAIEGEAVRIAKPVGIDFPDLAGARERIVVGMRYWPLALAGSGCRSSATD